MGRRSNATAPIDVDMSHILTRTLAVETRAFAVLHQAIASSLISCRALPPSPDSCLASTSLHASSPLTSSTAAAASAVACQARRGLRTSTTQHGSSTPSDSSSPSTSSSNESQGASPAVAKQLQPTRASEETVSAIRRRVFGEPISESIKDGRAVLARKLRGLEVASWYFLPPKEVPGFHNEEREHVIARNLKRRVKPAKEADDAPAAKGKGRR